MSGKILGVSITTIVMVIIVAVLARKYGGMVPLLKNV